MGRGSGFGMRVTTSFHRNELDEPVCAHCHTVVYDIRARWEDVHEEIQCVASPTGFHTPWAENRWTEARARWGADPRRAAR